MNIEGLYGIISDTGILSSLLPVILLLFAIKTTRRKLWRVLFLLSFTWLAAEFMSWFFARNQWNTYIIFHTFDLVSMILYVALYSSFQTDIRKKRFLKGVLIFYLLFSVIVLTATGSWFRPISFLSVITAVMPFALCLQLFYTILKEARIKNLMAEPIYWVNSAILIHFGLSAITEISLGIFYLEDSSLHYLWLIVIMSNIIHNILFSIGAWHLRRT